MLKDTLEAIAGFALIAIIFILMVLLLVAINPGYGPF